jgi:hypothetical protein
MMASADDRPADHPFLRGRAFFRRFRQSEQRFAEIPLFIHITVAAVALAICVIWAKLFPTP